MTRNEFMQHAAIAAITAGASGDYTPSGLAENAANAAEHLTRKLESKGVEFDPELYAIAEPEPFGPSLGDEVESTRGLGSDDFPRPVGVQS